MRNFKPSIFATAVIVAGALGLGGCASKDYVNEKVAVVDAKAQANQDRLNQHEDHLARLDQATQDALSRAEAAGKLAEGKFLYSMVLSDDSVKFPFDGSKLSQDAQQSLLAFVDKLKTDNRNVYLEIQGHTDSTGSASFNEALGEKRAEAVRLFLNQHGVALNRMATISYGEKDPATSNSTRAGRAQNRRVVLIVMA